MALLSPLALILAALALVVLAFHIRRRRTVSVPSLVIWRKVGIGQVKRNRVLQWPDPSWALFLQLLAVLAMVAALAQPLLNRWRDVDHWILVVDHSIAMQSAGNDGSLLAASQAQLRDRLANAAGGGSVSLIALGHDAMPLVARRPLGETGIAAAIDSIVPEDASADWSRLPSLLQSLVDPAEQTKVVIYSDRAQTIALASENANLTQEAAALPAPMPNASLAARLAADGHTPNAWTLTGQVHLGAGLTATDIVVNYAADAGDTPLEWTRRMIGDPAAAPSDAATDKSFSIKLALPGPGIISVVLSDDGNVADNSARFITNAAPQTLDVLYVGAGDQPLLNAIKAIDGTAIYQAEGLPADVSAYGLVVVDNVHVARAPETNVLWIGDAGVAGAPLPLLGALSVTAAQADHPLLRHVAWSDLNTDAAFAVTPAADAEILLSDNAVPLLAVSPTDYGQTITLAFDPRQSNWPTQPGLPVFAANLMHFLGLAPQGTLQASCHVGERCALDLRLAGGMITRLDALDAVAQPFRSASFVPERAGLYQIVNGAQQRLLAVNPVMAPDAVPAESTDVTGFPLPLWPFLLGLVILALTAEAIISGRGSERLMHAEGLRSANPLSTRRRVTLALRALALGLLLLALFNVPLPFRQGGAHLVALVAPGGTPAPGANAGVSNAAQPILASVAPDRAGDTAAAIALAAATVPWGEPGQIVVSGATQSDPDTLLALSDTLALRQIRIDSLSVSAADDPVSVAALETPSPVFAGDTFQLVGFVHAQSDMAATLTFARDGETLVEQQVALVAGDNRVETIVADIAEGPAEYSLAVKSAAAATDNDALTTLIDAKPAGTIAVIAQDAARADAFIGWLDSQGVTGELMEPDRAPYKPEDWQRFDGAALVDVPAIALATKQQEQLENAVAQQGMGLLILGGPNSFGPGGYLETPLERASPLSSRVPRDAPEATLVFVLDRSGSMQQPVGTGNRLDIAKQATLAAIRLLNRNSQVGVIVFDSDPTTVLPLGRLDDPEVVATALSNVDPGGGTSVYPGLEAAFDMLRDVDTPARHIIVMTDGLSQPADFPGLLAQIRDAGITVSSVSIGEGAERTLIEQIAQLGGGTFHATDDFAALPSILSQEAMLLSGSPIEQGATQPLWASRAEPFLRGLPPQMPPIEGFVLTTAKPEATLSMVVPDSKGEPMPLLASWRYGAGQVLALTTEAVGPWSGQWQQLPAYPALWAQALRQFLPGVERGDLVLDLVRRGDGFLADVTLQGESAGVVPTLSVAGADGSAITLPLNRIGSDRYEATYYPPDAGQFRFAAVAGALTSEKTIVMGYPAHLGTVVPDQGLRQLVAVTGGSFAAEALPPINLPDRWIFQSVWLGWLALALAILMLELTVRYTRLLKPKQPAIKPMQARPIAAAPQRAPEPAHTL